MGKEFKQITNHDIIDFRYKLIDCAYSNTYNIRSGVCNDGETNMMTPEKKMVLEDILIAFNIHFRERGYETG